jgi:hypothetical protein
LRKAHNLNDLANLGQVIGVLALVRGKQIDVTGQKIDNLFDELKRRIVYADW